MFGLTLRFSPRFFIGVALIAMVLMASVLAMFGWWDLQGIRQPVVFNHQKHVAGAGIECSDCHAGYSKSARSGLPAIEVCMNCHAEAVTESPEEARMIALAKQGQPLVFQKLFRLPSHVYYSHRRHVVLGKLECVRCHGTIAQSSSPPSKPLVGITMDFCVDCHAQSKVSNDCKVCHR